MKKFYTLMLLTVLNFSFAQNPLILNTNWYLHNVIVNGVNNVPPHSNMIFYIDLDYFMTNACNTMIGSILFENNSTSFSTTDYLYTLDMCFNPAAENYQNIYFPFFGEENGTSTPHNFTYTITESLGIYTLIINSEFNQQAIYSTAMLSKERFDKKTFSFYPNPSQDFIEINLNDTFTNSNTLEIYNEIGVLYKNEKLTSIITQIDIKNLASGIYFLKIKTENGTTVKKLIKK